MQRRALVTGGGTGIGRGIALALARRGWAVALAGRRAAPLEETAAEILAGGGQAAALPTDLSQPEACTGLVGRARQALGGGLHLLVCNAAVMLPGRFDHLRPGLLQEAIQVNLTAPMLLAQAALPDLRTGHGGLVLVASQAALLPLPYAALYSAGKAGLHAFGAALRYEFAGQGVHLLAAYPPATDTTMTLALSRPSWSSRFLADPLRIGEQIVAAQERGRDELHWLDYQTPLIWLQRLFPGLARRLLASQISAFRTMMNAEREEDEP